MSARVRALPLVLRHLRSGSGGLGVALLVLLLSLLATATPPALVLLADASLRDRLASISDAEASLQSTTAGVPQFTLPAGDAVPTTGAMWDPFLTGVDRVRSQADAPLPDLLPPASAVARNVDNPVLESPLTQALTVLADPAYEEQLTVVDGRLPEAGPLPIFGAGGETAPDRVEAVVSERTAAELEWGIGEIRTVGLLANLLEVELVGVFAPADPDAEYWQHVTSTVEPFIFNDGDRPRRVTGAVYVHPAMLPVGELLPGGQSTLVWFASQLVRIDVRTAEQTQAALRRVLAVGHDVSSASGAWGILSIRFSTELADAIELGRAQQAATAAVLAMVIAGPVGVAAAVLLLACRLILERRRPALRLLSARGASAGQLRGLLGIEGLVIGLLPAVVGAAGVAVAAGIAGVPPEPSWFVAPAIIALAPAAILTALATSAAERRARADLGAAHPRWRRIAEGAVVVLAAAAVVLLLVRGPVSSGIDPLVAAAPLLLSLVACVLTLRLYPAPLRAAVERARRGPGIAAFLGSARALREPAIGAVPVLALLVGVSVAVTSAVLLSTIARGIEASARGQVGGDLRITGAAFTEAQVSAVGEVDGVAAVASISGVEPSRVEADGQRRPATVVVVDGAVLRDVQGEGAGLLPPGADLTDTSDRMPIVVGPWTADAIGEAQDVTVEGVQARVVGVASGATPFGSRTDWIAIDAAHAEEVLGSTPMTRTIVVRLDDPAAADAVSAAIQAELGDTIRVASADEILGVVSAAPAVSGMRAALLAATAIAALLSALAIIMTLALAAAPRARVLALLRTLGAPPRASAALLAWEVGPPAVAAVVGGGIFGALVPLVVLAAVDLRPFTASTAQPAYAADPLTLLLTLGGFALLALIATGVALLAGRGMRAAAALRTVEEG